jgi:hypothetical protein
MTMTLDDLLWFKRQFLVYHPHVVPKYHHGTLFNNAVVVTVSFTEDRPVASVAFPQQRLVG